MEQALKEDRAAANLVSLILEEHLQTIIKTMESYASRPLLLQAVMSKNSKKAEVHLARLLNDQPVLKASSLQTDGARSGPAIPVSGDGRENFAYRDWYKGVSKEWKPYVSDIFLRVTGERIRL